MLSEWPKTDNIIYTHKNMNSDTTVTLDKLLNHLRQQVIQLTQEYTIAEG